MDVAALRIPDAYSLVYGLARVTGVGWTTDNLRNLRVQQAIAELASFVAGPDPARAADLLAACPTVHMTIAELEGIVEREEDSRG